MYDILQLNDMLVPELLDIAEQLKIAGAKKLEKQDLIYKILDKQALPNSATKGGAPEESGKRKRIVKASTSTGTEEAIVESDETPKPVQEKPVLDKKPGKRGRPAGSPNKNSAAEEEAPIPSAPVSEVAQENNGDIQAAENSPASDEAPAKQLFIKADMNGLQ